MLNSLVFVSPSESVRAVTLNRSSALPSMGAVDSAVEDPRICCVPLTGASRAVCAGQDRNDPLAAPDADSGSPCRKLGRVIESLWKPLVRRLRTDGVAAEACPSAAPHCDIVVASTGESTNCWRNSPFATWSMPQRMSYVEPPDRSSWGPNLLMAGHHQRSTASFTEGAARAFEAAMVAKRAAREQTALVRTRIDQGNRHDE